MAVKIGVYVCHCGVNIAGVVDVPAVVEFASQLEGVEVARDYRFMCSDPGQQLIRNDILENGLNRVVVASCSPLMHELTFRRAIMLGGLNPYYLQMANIREHCSWVTEDHGRATEKAKRLIAAAVRRVAYHEPLEIKEVPVNPNTLIVGGGIAGIEAALQIAEAGKKVYLVEREPSIGGQMAKFDKTFPTLDCAACILTPKMVAVGQHPNIELLTYAEVTDVSGYVGNFKVTIRQKPRYIEVDKCTGCAECEKVCPVEVESEFDEGLTPRKAIHRPFPQAVPSAFTIDKEDALSPCKATCPAQTNAHGYVALVREGKFKEALALIRQRNPFPAICGRVCHHPCEDECNRGKVDEPIAIATLKRFVADYELIEGMLEIPPVPEEKRPEEVAVVGSGPAGLTAAYDLVQMGYPVTIFEAAPRPGGMLTLGIPRYRLPRQLIDTEIRIIEQMGVEIKTNTRLGTDLTLEDLFQQGYRAVFIAVGAQEGKMLDLPGAEAEGVLNGLTFLWQVNLGEEVDLTGKRVVVIGGGNVAMDVARCALRVGARPVDIVCVESREMMPAHKWQVAATEEEILATEEELLAVDRGKHGIHCSLAPTQIVTENGQVKGVEFVPVKRLEFTEDGRLILETFPEPKTRLAADVVIMAVGQGIETEPLQAMGLKLTPRGTIEADPVTLETNRPGVFAGGDVVSGPSSIVEAIAAGHEGATSIDRFLRGVDLREGRVREVKKVTQVRPGVARQARQVMPMRPVEERIRSFAEVELGFTKEMALAEAARCLNCAVCSECLECVKACEPEAINHEMTEEFREIEVGTIILATGYELFDCSQLAQYGYGRLPNVITSLEFERMSSAGGPTGGKIQLQNGEPPSSVAILHCIGSRDENYQEYCSRVCCMYAMKFAHLVREKTQAKVYELYIDLRAFGKGYEEFYKRVMEEDVVFIRGKAAEVTDFAETPEEEGKLIVKCEDTLLGIVRRLPVDMVILCPALVPRQDAGEVAKLFGINRSRDGFFLEQHPKLAPVSTASDGIFLAGACQGPKDIPDSVAQGAAAAAESLSLIDRGVVEIEPITAAINEDVCAGCKICIGLCPYTAIYFDEEKNVSVVEEVLCKGCGACVAACPSGAARQYGFADQHIFAEIEGMLMVA